MRLLRSALVMLPLIAACGGDDGANEAAAVFPESGFIGRTTRVAVIGDGTNWSASTTVNFGDGVTVSNVEVAGPSALFVDVTVDPATDPGTLDVTVTDRGDTSTLPGAFEIESPISVEALIPASQGSLGLYSITNLDLLHPFDVTTDDNTGEFTALDVTFGDTGVGGFVANANESTVIIQVSADVDATAGELTLTSGSVVSNGGVLDVAARTAKVLTPGTPATGTLDATGADLYEVTLTAAQLASFSVTTTNEDADVSFSLLPADGVWPSPGGGAFTASDDRIVAAGTKFYISILDFNGATNVPYTLNVKTTADLTGVTAAAETEPNETSATAIAATLTGTVAHLTATLASDTDVDFFKVVVPANKVLRVVTTGGDTGGTDTQITVLNPNGTTITLQAPDGVDNDEDDTVDNETIDGFDLGVGDNVATATLTAGTYFVKIEVSLFASFFGYMPANDPYDLILSIENPAP